VSRTIFANPEGSNLNIQLFATSLRAVKASDQSQVILASRVRRKPDRIESQSWHEELLKETESRVESGEATFSNREKAKVSIHDRSNED
jgi:hypothetical protein